MLRLLTNRRFLVELFAVSNIAFLAVDIFMAHSTNSFANGNEWIPVVFSVAVTVLLILAAAIGRLERFHTLYHWTGILVGIGAIAVGIGGMLFHLDSQFFQQLSIKNLVYTAPFIAPLAYTGLGFLLLANRMIPENAPEWGRWVLFLALGGFVGNFVLSLCDHAQNGFYYWYEWIPVVSAGLAVGFLLTPFISTVNRLFYRLCFLVLAVQAFVGLLGFYFHIAGDLGGVSANLVDDFLYGAPLFAPLLFTNLAVLCAIALWDIIATQPQFAAERKSNADAAPQHVT